MWRDIIQVVFVLVILVDTISLLRLELPLPASLAHHMPLGRIFSREDPSADLAPRWMILLLCHELLMYMNNMSIDVAAPGERFVAPWPGARVLPLRLGRFTVPIRGSIVSAAVILLIILVSNKLFQGNLLAFRAPLPTHAIHSSCLFTRRRVGITALCSTHGLGSDCQPCPVGRPRARGVRRQR